MPRVKSGGLSAESVEESFRRKEFSPIYLLSGDEDFLIEELTERLIEEALDDSGKSFNLDVLYGSDLDGKDLSALAAAYPMMGERRVIIVREFDKMANKDALLPYVEQPLSSTILVIVVQKRDERQKIYKSLKEGAVLVECNRLYEDKLPAWIRGRIEKMGKSATHEACQLIQASVGRSLRETQNEIDKLFIFVGEKKSIEADDVTTVVGVSKHFNIFELQKALGGRRVEQAMEILDRMLEAGEQPIGIVLMLTRFFQKLWILPDLRSRNSNEFQLAAAMGVNPFHLKDYVSASNNFNQRQVESSLAALLEADLSLKSSGGDSSLIMTLLLHATTRQQPILEKV